MANETINQYDLCSDEVYNLCFRNIEEKLISELLNFYVYNHEKYHQEYDSQEEFMDKYDSIHHFEYALDDYIEDNYQDILDDDELEDVYDDIDADSVINKRMYGGGGFESKQDFVEACVERIIEIIKNKYEK